MKHYYDYLMHMLQYCICLWVLDTGLLTLNAICITHTFEMKCEFTSIVIDNLLTCGYQLNQVLFTEVLIIAYDLSRHACLVVVV